jgi:hypothetical protein
MNDTVVLSDPMSRNSEHAYPPATWQTLVEDPQFLAFVDHVVESRTKEFQDAHARDSEARESAMKLWAEEVQARETAFQAQIAALSDELAAKRLQQRYNFHFYYLWLPEF